MRALKDKAGRYAEAFGGAQRLADDQNRTRKAEKIRAVLVEEGIWPDPRLRLLDIGCSFGIILRKLAAEAGYGVGVDFDHRSMGRPDERCAMVCADAESLPFASGSFDVVICNHVYEHTDDPARMLGEIDRVLSPKGVCYFAGPNKHDLIEPHYGLPFLSWMPRPLADRYLRMTGRGDQYLERPYSYRSLKKLLGNFEIEDYTARIVRDPVRYNATDVLTPGSGKQLLARFVLRVAPFLFPGFIFVLRKGAS
jgi:SAM-dependent methyltransferase